MDLAVDKKDIKKVLELENRRTKHNYKKGWTYYQCQHLDLVDAYNYLRQSGALGKKNNSDMWPLEKRKSLTIELVPENCWFSNVRSEVTKQEWNKLKAVTSKAANHRCEICGGRGPNWPVECHEIWHYDDEHKKQTLGGLISLCPACHEVKHIGLANINNRGDIAAKHLADVNGWNMNTTVKYIEKQFDIWSQRSAHQWTLNIQALNRYGIDVSTHDRPLSENSDIDLLDDYFHEQEDETLSITPLDSDNFRELTRNHTPSLSSSIGRPSPKLRSIVFALLIALVTLYFYFTY